MALVVLADVCSLAVNRVEFPDRNYVYSTISSGDIKMPRIFNEARRSLIIGASAVTFSFTKKSIASETSTSSPAGRPKSADDSTEPHDLFSGPSGASLIGFLQAGANAVMQSVQDALRGRVNAAQFGARGDGVTDDTAALLAAIAYGKRVNKRVDLIDGCVYITSAPLYLDSSGALGCSKARGATIRKITNTIGSGSSRVGNVRISYAVDAVIIVRFPDNDFAYNVDIDGVNIDALQAKNSYGIYAPRISQSRIRNGYMSGVRTGIRSLNAWLCEIKNMNIACGDPAAPKAVRPGSVAYEILAGTSLSLVNAWARITETGFRFQNLSYSAMSASVCEYFTGTAYEFTGSNISTSGCGAENNVGTTARLYKLNNSRVVVDAMQTYALSNIDYFFWLNGSEAQITMPRIVSDTAGFGKTFYLRGNSSLDLYGRQYPTNTAVVYDYDNGSQIIIRDRDNGIVHHFWDKAADANNWGTLTGKVSWGTAAPRGTLYGSTTPKLSLEGTSFGTSIFSLIANNVSTGNAGEIALGKSRSAKVGGVGLVLDGDTLGIASFHGGDGRVMALGAMISGIVDGAATAGSMPTRLSFSVRRSGDPSPTERLRISGDGTIRAGNDNTQNLGAAACRWATIYAGTGTINTSDEHEKQQVRPIDAAILRAWEKVQYAQYKFNDAVKEKGDGARWHFGVIAQRVKAAFESEGLDAFSYGVLCYDEWDDEWTNHQAEYRDSEVLNSSGKPKQILVREARREKVREAGSRFGIRYEEALILECALLRSRLPTT